jgi:hypothetical protein
MEELAVQLSMSTCFNWYFENVLHIAMELIDINANKGVNKVMRNILKYLFLFCFNVRVYVDTTANKTFMTKLESLNIFLLKYFGLKVAILNFF